MISLAERLRLIRNHGEAVIQSSKAEDLANILGHNFRLGEIEAAIAREQLHKLPSLVASRQAAAARLTEGVVKTARFDYRPLFRVAARMFITCTA